MEKISECKKLLEEMSRKLNGEDLSSLDFDLMRAGLIDTADLLDKTVKDIGELMMLRQDYINRISGLEKAIAVAGRRDGSLKNALMVIEGLQDLSAGELIEQYTKTQARFRDAFPTSFGLLPSSGTRAQRRNIAEYK